MKSPLLNKPFGVPLLLLAGFGLAFGVVWSMGSFFSADHGSRNLEFRTFEQGFMLVSSLFIGVVSGISLVKKQGFVSLYKETGWFSFLTFLLIFALFWMSNPVYAGHWTIFRFFWMLSGMFFLLRTLGWLAKKRKEYKALWVNLALSGLALIFVWSGLEASFLWVSRPHGYNFTLASRRWFAKNWTLNKQGYRENTERYDWEVSKRILVLGDSFTAGHGVKENDRFSDVLEKHLNRNKREVLVHNLGVVGADPLEELKNLNTFPQSGDLLVLQWYVNDIDMAHVAVSEEKKPKLLPFYGLDPVRYWLVQHSTVLNYIYFSSPDQNQSKKYQDFIHQAFASSATLNHHKKDLDNIIDVALSHHIPMVAVVFPFLNDIEAEKEGIDEVLKHFYWTEIPVIDVRKLVENIDPAERTVNSNDGHPSYEVHQRVGHALAKMIKEKGMLK